MAAIVRTTVDSGRKGVVRLVRMVVSEVAVIVRKTYKAGASLRRGGASCRHLYIVVTRIGGT